jgi:hypothetical protein
MSDGELGQQDIALVHLVCAAGLPGAEDLDIPRCLSQIEEWTDVVRQETIRGFPRYHANPDPNKGSEAVYRLWAVMYTLRYGIGLKHIMTARENGDPDAQPRRVTGGPYKSFTDADTVFLHGLLGPRRMGSCSSLPVLYAAVGRRLGYPLKLVLTVQHIFNRWVSPEESFNMDGCAKFIAGDDYEHYIDWPRKWRPAERASTTFLRPATPREELAASVFTRCGVLSANEEFDEALRVCKIASQLSPDNPAYTNEIETIQDNRDIKQLRSGWPDPSQDQSQPPALLLDGPTVQTSVQYSLPPIGGMNSQQYTIIEVSDNDRRNTAR